MKKIAVLPGDGIGQEVTAEAIKVLDTISEKYGHDFEYEYALVGGAAVDAHGTALPQETLDLCRKSDAILFGAAGGPKWDNLLSHVVCLRFIKASTNKSIDEHKANKQRVERALATIRKELDLYVNLASRSLLRKPPSDKGKTSVSACEFTNGEAPYGSEASPTPEAGLWLPVKREIVGDGLDFVVIRELTGGLYYGEPRGIFEETDGKRKGLNTLVYTDYEVERIARAAFELARTRSKRVTSVAKENMMESSRLWRDVVTEVSNDYPDVELNHILIDAATNKPASGVGEPCEHTISSEIYVSLM